MLNYFGRSDFETVIFEGLNTYFASVSDKQEQSQYWQMVRVGKFGSMTMPLERS